MTVAFGQVVRPSDTLYLPGGYLRLTSAPPQPVSLRGGVAIAARATWGVPNTPQTCYGIDDIPRYFGGSPLLNSLAAQAFAGGASYLQVTRLGSGTGVGAALGVAGTLTLNDTTAVTPVAVKTATLVSVGSRGFSLTIRASTTVPGKLEWVLYDTLTGAPVEVKQFGTSPAGATSAADFMAAANGPGGSSYFTVATIAAGNGILAMVTQAPFVGGTDPTIIASSFDNAQAALQALPWFTYCNDSEDPVQHASSAAWIDSIIKNIGMRRTASFGLPISTNTQAAIMAAANAINDPAVSYFGNDFTINVQPGNVRTVIEGARAAARIAGMIACMRPTWTMSVRQLPDATGIATDLTQSQLVAYKQAGVLAVSRDHRGRVATSEGVNTFFNPNLPPTWMEQADTGWEYMDRTVRVFTIVDDVFTALLDRMFDPNPDQRPPHNDAGAADLKMVGQRVLNTYVPQALTAGSVLRLDPAAPVERDTFRFIIDPFIDITGVDKVVLTLKTQPM